jgi:hypothetical protein
MFVPTKDALGGTCSGRSNQGRPVLVMLLHYCCMIYSLHIFFNSEIFRNVIYSVTAIERVWLITRTSL